jgi:hypothetical protein
MSTVEPETLGGPSLDKGTKLVVWHVKVFPEAGEAVIHFSGPEVEREDPGPATDPEECRRKAAARARTKTRRYCKANALFRLATLTYAIEAVDRAQVRADVRAFIKRLRAECFDGELFAYVWVIEKGEKNGRLHLHLGIPKYVAHADLARIWGKGFVFIQKLGQKDRCSAREMSVRAASYLSKYVGKSVEDTDGREAGEHRYEVGQGFQPAEEATWFPGTSAGEVCARLWSVYRMGGEVPSFVWSSDQLGEAWRAPPVRVLFWP